MVHKSLTGVSYGFLACLAFLLAPESISEEPEGESPKTVWSCKALFGNENILWLVEWGNNSYVKVFDDRISAKYSMDGLDKRWDWGRGFSYTFAITLGPDKEAAYYDFTGSEDGRAKASAIYKCSK